MKSTRLLLSMVALSSGLIVSGRTRAEEGLVGQLGFFGVGKAYEIEKGMAISRPNTRFRNDTAGPASASGRAFVVCLKEPMRV